MERAHMHTDTHMYTHTRTHTRTHTHTHKHTHAHTRVTMCTRIQGNTLSAVLTYSKGQTLAGILNDIVPVPPAVRTWLL